MASSSKTARRLRSGWTGNWTTHGLDEGLGQVSTSPPKTTQHLWMDWAGATEKSKWTDRLQDNAAPSIGLSRSSGGATRERTAPSADDAGSSEGLGRGNGVVGLNEIGCAQATPPLRPGQAVVTEELEEARSPSLEQRNLIGWASWGYGGEERRAPAKARQTNSYWRARGTLSFLAPRFPRVDSKPRRVLSERRARL